MKELLLLFLYMVIPSLAVTAQGVGSIIFEKKAHDFGTFSEDGGNQTCEFKFVNRGKKAVSIAHVQSTCGCAVASYTRRPVPAGKTGSISVTYNPAGRPGKFNRSVLVHFAGTQEKLRLTISGTVSPGVERKDKRFPYVMGGLQLKITGFRFSPMRGKEQEQEIMVVNSGKSPLQVHFTSSDPVLSGSMEPETLLPDSIGKLLILRKADASKSQRKCIRLKENKNHSRTDGVIRIEITQETCK